MPKNIPESVTGSVADSPEHSTLETRLLAPRDAATVLGIHPLTLYRWGKDGVLNVVSTPTDKSVRLQYPEQEVMELKAQLTSKALESNLVEQIALLERVARNQTIRAQLFESLGDEENARSAGAAAMRYDDEAALLQEELDASKTNSTLESVS